MALDPKQIQQLRKDLAEINKIYSRLGKDKIEIDINAAGVEDIELLNQYLQEARVAAIDLDDGFGGIAESIKNIVREWKPGFADPAKEATKSFSKLKSLAQKLSDDVNDITKLREKDLDLILTQAKQEKKRLELIRQELESKEELSEVEEAILANLKSEYKVQEDIIAQTKKRIKEEQKITELTGLTGQALDGASGILKKIGLNIGSDKFKELEQGARDYAEELANGEENLSDSQIKAKVLSKTLTDGAKIFSKELGAAFDVAVFKGFKKGLKEFGAAREDLAKTFGLGRSDANQLKTELNFAANNSGELHFNIADAVKGIQEFNEQVGLSIKLTASELKTFSLLSNEFGLTNEQAAQFIKSAKIRGESAEDFTNELRGQIAILAEQEGVAVNQQAIFADIGNISAANRLTMEGQGKSLANAAFQSAKLGLSQQQLENTSNSLLDFESSIAAEMEAELMTGKQLNLEEARRAALMGDQEGLAKAIQNEIGTAAEFGAMNVLQQNSLAKAFGMSREELAKTLETQELLNGESKSMTEATEAYNKAMEDGVITAEEQRKIGAEQLTNQLHAEAASKRFEDAMIKLKDQLVPLIEMFGKFLDFVMDGIEGLSSMKGVLTSISKVVAGIAAFRLFGRIGGALKIFSNIKSTLSGISKTASKLPKALGGTGGAVKEGTKAATSTAAKSTASAGTKAAAGGASKGFFGSVGKFFSKLNPLNAAKEYLSKNVGSFLKTGAKKIPLIGTAIEGVFAASDISAMIGSGETGAKLNQMVGKRTAEAIGSIGGSILGGILGSFIPIPGVGTLLGALAGDALGRWVGGALADAIGAEGLGSAVIDLFGSGDVAEDFISRPGQPIQKFRADDVIVGGTNLGGGGSGEVITLLERIASAIEKGGDVYIDGAKAGRSMALATSKIG